MGGGGGGGGGRSPKTIFWPFGPQFGLKIRGGGPYPGSATAKLYISAPPPRFMFFLSTEFIKLSADPASNDTFFLSKGTFPDPTTQAPPITTSISTTAKSSTAAALTTRAETTPQTKGTMKVTTAMKTTVKATRTAKVTERLVWTV